MDGVGGGWRLWLGIRISLQHILARSLWAIISRAPLVCAKSFAKVFFDHGGSMAPPLPRANTSAAMSVVTESSPKASS